MQGAEEHIRKKVGRLNSELALKLSLAKLDLETFGDPLSRIMDSSLGLKHPPN